MGEDEKQMKYYRKNLHAIQYIFYGETQERSVGVMENQWVKFTESQT